MQDESGEVNFTGKLVVTYYLDWQQRTTLRKPS